MKILVCISHVPDTTAKISFTDDGNSFNSEGVQYIIGPYDDYALSKAVDLKTASGGSLTVLTVGDSSTEPSLKKALAIGADDAVRINIVPTNSQEVAKEIAAYAKDKSFDLIMMGRETIDFSSGIVHILTAKYLDLPCVTPIMDLEVSGGVANVKKEMNSGTAQLKVKLPVVLGCQEPIAEWKIPNMRGIMTARTKPMEILEPSSQTAKNMEITSYHLPKPKGSVRIFNEDEIDEAAKAIVDELDLN
ncbi:electron transfer flavoprotein subunit beta/FixA family protein [Aureibacter tunicatorum]|uniref:Electron transfer flavoprotein beta subunit n=1 Tax=Aureibacter tunicatorum TaxID=866807 RepID=A0AAE3XNF3_9BACT|nr:electron transfer flavoprotein subunit beta/FixA family protein [Aureibacter tunicatorum]MDR6239099.1 electron transfer flavoprotein beta subunit [Aureibacter tunicatorum]BDD04975.1 electron transfer flavoprotein subunit alpha [Aureibacter tunicatorum]